MGLLGLLLGGYARYLQAQREETRYRQALPVLQGQQELATQNAALAHQHYILSLQQQGLASDLAEFTRYQASEEAAIATEQAGMYREQAVLVGAETTLQVTESQERIRTAAEQTVGDVATAGATTAAAGIAGGASPLAMAARATQLFGRFAMGEQRRQILTRAKGAFEQKGLEFQAATTLRRSSLASQQAELTARGYEFQAQGYGLQSQADILSAQGYNLQAQGLGLQIQWGAEDVAFGYQNAILGFTADTLNYFQGLENQISQGLSAGMG